MGTTLEEMNKSVAIVLVNYNSWQDTIECVESLLKSDFEGKVAIYIVDNCSVNASFDRLVEWAHGKLDTEITPGNPLCHLSNPPAKKPFGEINHGDDYLFITDRGYRICLFQSEKNGGFAYGNNLAIAKARGDSHYDFFWLLNGDTVVPPDTLSHFVNETRRFWDQPILAGGTVRWYHHPDRIQCLGGNKYYRIGTTRAIGAGLTEPLEFKEEELDYISGACMFVNATFLDRVGMMSEKYFMYFEETDWAKRAKNLGVKLRYVKNAVVYHKDAATMKTKFWEYYYTRNKLIFTKEFYGMFWVILIYLCLPLVILRRVINSEWDMIPVVLRAFLFMDPRR